MPQICLRLYSSVGIRVYLVYQTVPSLLRKWHKLHGVRSREN